MGWIQADKFQVPKKTSFICFQLGDFSSFSSSGDEVDGTWARDSGGSFATTLGVSGVRSKSSGKSSAKKKKTDLDIIIDQQGSGGEFRWSKEFEKVLGIKKNELDANRMEGIDKEAWLTAVIVVYLEQKMLAEKDLWELMVQKARKCVMKMVGGSSEKNQAIFDKAVVFVNAI